MNELGGSGSLSVCRGLGAVGCGVLSTRSEGTSANKQFPASFAALTTTITAPFSRAATETLNVMGHGPAECSRPIAARNEES